jgi:WD40 repeat protein
MLAALVAFLGLSVGARLIVGEETAFGVTGAHSIAVSGDGRLVATSSGASRVRLWNITGPRQPMLQSSFDAGGTSLAISPDAHTIAVVDDRIRLWDITDPTRPTRAATLPTYTRHTADAPWSAPPAARTPSTSGPSTDHRQQPRPTPSTRFGVLLRLLGGEPNCGW